jgi:hypothetical protein
MGLNIDVNVSGDENLTQALSDFGNVWIPEEFESMLERIIRESIEEAQKYPPETEGNRPPPPYYIRGTGMIGRGGNVTKPSENLKDQWHGEVTQDSQGATGRISNEASYASFVQDEELQTTFHAAHGWRPIQSIVRSVTANRGGGGATAGAGDPESGIINRVENMVNRLIQRIR